MSLRLSIRWSLVLFAVGLAAFQFWFGIEAASWFGLGGALALANVFLAAWSVKIGFKALKQSSMFMGLLLLKSLSFIGLVAVVLVFLKPLLLPFTLGISVVIVGATLAAVWEMRRAPRDETI